ncbi:FadR/GntR family transcriptional regulator [Acidothermaceae bacterium B102]|nr:FadR/GntR family transcriptional regulator [Acidothermaceae bacterium B102]
MSLTDDAVERIKAMIISGELRPGERLPREQELAASLGLSRGSLREAVRALSVLRVLETRQGDGTFVTSLSPAVLIDAMSFIVDFHRDETVLHFFHVRRVLEAEAAAAAARHVSSDQLARLAGLLKVAAELAARKPVDHHAMLANDQLFHGLITEAGGNPVLAAVVESMSGQTTRARIWRGLADEDASVRTVEEHRAIYEALLDGDSDRARLRAAVHVCGVEDWLRLHLAEVSDGVAGTLEGSATL